MQEIEVDIISLKIAQGAGHFSHDSAEARVAEDTAGKQIVVGAELGGNEDFRPI